MTSNQTRDINKNDINSISNSIISLNYYTMYYYFIFPVILKQDIVMTLLKNTSLD